MAYINLAGGLKVNTADSVDSRLVLTKAEMKSLRYADNETRPTTLRGKLFQLPTNYFCVCMEDNQIYLYNSVLEDDEVTGKFRVLETSSVNELIIKVTYADLVLLRNSSQLIPGAFYRIIDYEATSSLPYVEIYKKHHFDIVVQALSENTLSEDARGAMREDELPKVFKVLFTDGVILDCYVYLNGQGLNDHNIVDVNTGYGYTATLEKPTDPTSDVDYYANIESTSLDEHNNAFKGLNTCYYGINNPNAWILKYTLDNNNNKYEWADPVNGKGVIFYLKDAFNNEAYFDFKSIMYIIPEKEIIYNQWGSDYEVQRDESLDTEHEGTQYYGYRCDRIPSAWSTDYFYITDSEISSESVKYNSNFGEISYGGTLTVIDNKKHGPMFMFNNVTLYTDDAVDASPSSLVDSSTYVGFSSFSVRATSVSEYIYLEGRAQWSFKVYKLPRMIFHVEINNTVIKCTESNVNKLYDGEAIPGGELRNSIVLGEFTDIRGDMGGSISVPHLLSFNVKTNQFVAETASVSTFQTSGIEISSEDTQTRGRVYIGDEHLQMTLGELISAYESEERLTTTILGDGRLYSIGVTKYAPPNVYKISGTAISGISILYGSVTGSPDALGGRSIASLPFMPCLTLGSPISIDEIKVNNLNIDKFSLLREAPESWVDGAKIENADVPRSTFTYFKYIYGSDVSKHAYEFIRLQSVEGTQGGGPIIATSQVGSIKKYYKFDPQGNEYYLKIYERNLDNQPGDLTSFAGATWDYDGSNVATTTLNVSFAALNNFMYMRDTIIINGSPIDAMHLRVVSASKVTSATPYPQRLYTFSAVGTTIADLNNAYVYICEINTALNDETGSYDKIVARYHRYPITRS